MSAVNELVITPEFVTNIIAVDLADETTFTTADKAKLNGIEAGAQVNTVTRVAGKTGVVELDAGDIAYDASETYASGKIGAALKSAEEKLDALDAGDIGYDGSATYDTGTVGKELTELNRQISEKADVIIDSASGSIASFADGADDMPIKSLVVNIEPVQTGSGDPSPTNVRPISGHTGASVTRTGKNLFDGSAVATTHPDNWAVEYQNDRLSITHKNSYSSGAPLYAIRLDVGVYVVSYAVQSQAGNISLYVDGDWSRTIASGAVLTLESGHVYAIGFSAIANTTNYIDRFQIELGSTATDYEPYTGNTLSVTFPSEAGTVYGGTLTINPDRTGSLVVDRAIYTWSSGGYLTNTKVFALIKQDVVTIDPTNQTTLIGAICNKLKSGTWGRIANESTEYLAGCVYGQGLAIRIPGYTTVDEYSTWIAENQPVFCYLLATPITIPLTESEISGILSTLYGTNNIWTDVGTVDVEYPADTKLYIEQLTKPTEDDMTANANIAANKFFMIGNTLYFSTTAIAQGATIIPGTNCNVISLADALNNLNS